MAAVAPFVLVACGYPTYTFVSSGDSEPDDTGTPSDAATDTADGDGLTPEVAPETHPDTNPPPTDSSGKADTAPPCPILGGGDVCKKIPKFTASKQILDGVGDEFCDVPATRFLASSAAYMDPDPPPSGIDTITYVRAAWSSEGLHVHVRVEQSLIFPPRATEEIWRGDAIELFAAGYSALHGRYDGTSADPGAIQVIAAPASADGAVAQRAEFFTSSTFGAFSAYATRLLPGAYEVEVKFLWSDLKGVPGSGVNVAFDLGVDVRQSASPPKTPILQSFVGFKSDTPTDAAPFPCNPITRPKGHPSCDDLTWCTPTLE